MSRDRTMPVEFIEVDRFCVACGANLAGAPVIRESHYDMLIARCGSCDQIAHIQETSKLSRAAQRWVGVGVGLWMLLMAALWLGGSAAMFGITYGFIEVARSPLGEHIRELYEQYKPADAGGNFETDVSVTFNTPGAPPTITINREDSELINRFGIWWAQQDPQALLAQAGGPIDIIDWANLRPLLLLAVFPFIFGVVWSILMLNIRRRFLIATIPVTTLVYVLMCLASVIYWKMIPPGKPSEASITIIGPLLTFMSMAYLLLALYAGMMTGRSIVRGVMKLALSPRAISRLSQLWLVDGYKPPRVQPAGAI